MQRRCGVRSRWLGALLLFGIATPGCDGGQSGDSNTIASGGASGSPDAGCPYPIGNTSSSAATTDASAIAARYAGVRHFPVLLGGDGRSAACPSAGEAMFWVELELTPRESAAELGEKPCGAAWIAVDVRLRRQGPVSSSDPMFYEPALGEDAAWTLEPGWLSEDGRVLLPRPSGNAASIVFDRVSGAVGLISGLGMRPFLSCCLSGPVLGQRDPVAELNTLGLLSYTPAADYSQVGLTGMRAFSLELMRKQPASGCYLEQLNEEPIGFRVLDPAAQLLAQGDAVLYAGPCSVPPETAPACVQLNLEGESPATDAAVLDAGAQLSVLPSKLWLHLRWQPEQEVTSARIDLSFDFVFEPAGIEAVLRNPASAADYGQ